MPLGEDLPPQRPTSSWITHLWVRVHRGQLRVLEEEGPFLRSSGLSGEREEVTLPYSFQPS